MQTVSSTPISPDLRIAAPIIWRASSSSSLKEGLIWLSRWWVIQWLRSAAAIDGLDLGVEFKAGAPGLAERRRAGALEAAKRGVDEIAGRRAVDLDGPRFDVMREVVDVARIARRDRGGQPYSVSLALAIASA
jgi:hypothetical protein